MRALACAFVILAVTGAIGGSRRACASEQSVQLASVKAVRLFVTPYGEKPCDFARDRFMSDMKFVLNTAGIDFVDGLSTEHPEWPLLEAVLSSFATGGTCIWNVQITLSARITNGVVLGKAYDGWIDLWTGGGFGTHPGNGLTAYTSEMMQGQLRDMVNEIYASRKSSATQ